MRKGINPVKRMTSVVKPERITVTVLNHIPFLEGFYSEMLEVLEISLRTLRDKAGMPFDLLVFDNGSCEKARDFLLDEFSRGHIQQLILSDKNVGKGGAWNTMLQAAPGEIVGYADNDILYYDNWLLETVRVLETYPNVGMVTSRPYHSLPELYSAVVDWGAQNDEVNLEKGHLINAEWMREFLLSLGRTEDEIAQDIAQEDVRLTYQGLTAFAGASHWQFVGWKSTLQEFLPIDLSKPMGQVIRFDEMVNQKGYLRLMTAEPYVMNLSNSLALPNAESSNQPIQNKMTLKQKIFECRLIKSPLMRIYNAIFNLYYDNGE